MELRLVLVAQRENRPQFAHSRTKKAGKNQKLELFKTKTTTLVNGVLKRSRRTFQTFAKSSVRNVRKRARNVRKQARNVRKWGLKRSQFRASSEHFGNSSRTPENPRLGRFWVPLQNFEKKRRFLINIRAFDPKHRDCAHIHPKPGHFSSNLWLLGPREVYFSPNFQFFCLISTKIEILGLKFLSGRQKLRILLNFQACRWISTHQNQNFCPNFIKISGFFQAGKGIVITIPGTWLNIHHIPKFLPQCASESNVFCQSFCIKIQSFCCLEGKSAK